MMFSMFSMLVWKVAMTIFNWDIRPRGVPDSSLKSGVEYMRIAMLATRSPSPMEGSSQGWVFGGGTILNIPFGETMGILDRADEKKYEYKGMTN
jgi:hypothetical protein